MSYTRVAVIGSRDYHDLAQVREFVRTLDPATTLLVTGGARGVDRAAENEARRRGIRCAIYLPDYTLFGRYAPLERNRLIVNDCDRVVAFHDGKSRGTMHAIGLARKAGKSVEIVKPRATRKDGT